MVIFTRERIKSEIQQKTQRRNGHAMARMCPKAGSYEKLGDLNFTDDIVLKTEGVEGFKIIPDGLNVMVKKLNK